MSVPMVLRVVAAVAALVSAVVHLRLWFDGVRDQSVGPAFMVNAAAGLVIAVLLLTWQHWVPALLVVGFGICTLGAFTISTTVGLFGVHDRWVGGYVWTAAVAEVVAIVTGLLLLARENPLRSGGQLEDRTPAGRQHLH